MPESFKGGFVAEYTSPAGALRLEYVDMEMTVSLGSRELFGSNHHPGFAGNMFSRDNLIRSLPNAAAAVQRELQA